MVKSEQIQCCVGNMIKIQTLDIQECCVLSTVVCELYSPPEIHTITHAVFVNLYTMDSNAASVALFMLAHHFYSVLPAVAKK